MAIFSITNQDPFDIQTALKDGWSFPATNFWSERVQEGEFRQDLFYRLNVISIVIPPLRDRVGDIPMLTDFFADKFCMELGVGHIEVSNKVKRYFLQLPLAGKCQRA